MKPLLNLTLFAATIGLGSAAFALGLQPSDQARQTLSGSATPADSYLMLADNDDDDHRGWIGNRRGGDDDEDDCENGDDDDEQNAGCGATGRMNSAPTGPTTPPQNGLFGNGKAPQVQSN